MDSDRLPPRARHLALWMLLVLVLVGGLLRAEQGPPPSALPSPAPPAPQGTAPSPPQQTAALTVSPLKGSPIHDVGERIAWDVAASDESVTSISYTLQKNGLTTYRTDTLVLSAGRGRIETSIDEPGAVLLRIASGTPGGRGGVMAGGLVAPRAIQPSAPRPADFDEWWAGNVTRLQSVPIGARLTARESGRPGVDYALVTLDNVNGAHVQGQVARPSRAGTFPALVILQWAGVYSLPPSRVVDRAAEGWLAVNIEPHDIPSDQPADYYSNLAKTTLGNYQAIGQESRETSYFLQMYLAAYRALDYVVSRPDWDGKTLVVQGTSMGGQQSIAMAGLHPRVTALVVMVPSGIDVTAPLHDRAAGFPDWARDARTKNAPAILEAAQYFDPMNFASRVKVPALVAMGLYDVTSPPVGIWAAINQMKGPVEPLPMASGHQDVNNSQGPYKVRSVEWLGLLLKGQVPGASSPPK
jgi:cephalosporin-C deacetylase